MDVEQHGPGRIGVIRHMHLSAGETPDEPGFNGAEQKFSVLRLAAGPVNIIQNPLELRGRKIGIDDQSGLLTELFCQPLGLQRVTVFTGAPTLPDNGRTNRLPRLLVPNHCGFPLIGDADGGNVVCTHAQLIHRRQGHAQLCGPDFISIMLHPARFGKVLCKLLLCHTAHFPRFIKEDAAARGGTGIQCHNIFRHSFFLPALCF